jgi:hypothetical protein
MRFCRHVDTNKLNNYSEVALLQSMEAYGGVDIKLHPLITSELD